MCTVTVIGGSATGGSRWVRIACNRDELRSRPVALPPRRMRFGVQQAILPLDPVSGGTWIAVSDAGLAFAVLNVNQGHYRPRAGQISRGLVIPTLLGSFTLNEAAERASEIDTARYSPFRLMIATQSELLELISTGSETRTTRRRQWERPQFFTSSGLGDDVAAAPRQRVFRQLLDHEHPTSEAQDALHRHHWPERPEISICMQRPDARTVSFTTLEIRADRVTLVYQGDAPNSHASTWSLSLRRQGALVG